MRRTTAVVATCVALIAATVGRADDPAAPAKVKDRVAGIPKALDALRERADADARLKVLERVADKDLTPAQKTLRDILNERIRLFDELRKASDSARAAEKPNPTPEAEATDRGAELERATALLNQAAKSSNVLLPDNFRNVPATLDDAKLAELRDTIESAKKALNDRTGEFDRLGTEPAARTALLKTLRAGRDAIRERVMALPARRLERETALSAATDDNARLIARDRLVNLAWEESVEKERLVAAEAAIALETRRAAILDVAIRAKEGNVKLAKMTVVALTDRYRALAERRKSDLNRAAADESSRAEKSGRPARKVPGAAVGRAARDPGPDRRGQQVALGEPVDLDRGADVPRRPRRGRLRQPQGGRPREPRRRPRRAPAQQRLPADQPRARHDPPERAGPVERGEHVL